VGTAALVRSTSGLGNVAVGSTAGCNVTTGGGNVIIGSTTSTNAYNPVFDVTNQNEIISLGSAAVVGAYVKVAWTVVSDAREKIVKGPVPHGLEFVKKLEPKAFHFKENRESDVISGPLRYGFIAQEILELEGDESVIIDNQDENILRYNGEALVPVLVNAIKELASNLEELTAENAELRTDFEEYKRTHP
jgi:hypothetical protein